MEKLELKHIQHYDLQTLEFIVPKVDNSIRKIAKINPIIGYVEDQGVESWSFEHIKFILRPMSDLYKPLEDGSIPIVELAKLATESYGEFDYTLITRNNVQEVEDIEVICKHKDFGAKLIFKYSDFILGFALLSKEDGEAATVFNQLELFEYLFEHHFDVYGLIEKGLAIYENTLQY